MENNQVFINKSSYLNSLSEEDFDKLSINYLKFNIPMSIESYNSSNGEGCWALPYSEKDQKLFVLNEKGTFAKIILCNDSVYFQPLIYGTVLQVEIRGGDIRPILDINWMQKKLNGIIDFIELLK